MHLYMEEPIPTVSGTVCNDECSWATIHSPPPSYTSLSVVKEHKSVRFSATPSVIIPIERNLKKPRNPPCQHIVKWMVFFAFLCLLLCVFTIESLHHVHHPKAASAVAPNPTIDPTATTSGVVG